MGCPNVCKVGSFSDCVCMIGSELDAESDIVCRWFTRRRFSRKKLVLKVVLAFEIGRFG